MRCPFRTESRASSRGHVRPQPFGAVGALFLGRKERIEDAIDSINGAVAGIGPAHAFLTGFHFDALAYAIKRPLNRNRPPRPGMPPSRIASPAGSAGDEYSRSWRCTPKDFPGQGSRGKNRLPWPRRFAILPRATENDPGSWQWNTGPHAHGSASTRKSFDDH